MQWPATSLKCSMTTDVIILNFEYETLSGGPDLHKISSADDFCH